MSLRLIEKFKRLSSVLRILPYKSMVYLVTLAYSVKRMSLLVMLPLSLLCKNKLCIKTEPQRGFKIFNTW